MVSGIGGVRPVGSGPRARGTNPDDSATVAASGSAPRRPGVNDSVSVSAC